MSATLIEQPYQLTSPTSGLRRLDRVKLALEFMRSPLGQRIKNALVARIELATAKADVTVESLLAGMDVGRAVSLLLLAEADPSTVDPRLAALSSGAIDLQPEEGPSLDDLYDSAILRVNAGDALDYFLASDIEQGLGAFLLFFSPLMPPDQAARLLQSLREIMPGTQIVQGPLAAPMVPPEGDMSPEGDDETASGTPDEEEPQDVVPGNVQVVPTDDEDDEDDDDDEDDEEPDDDEDEDDEDEDDDDEDEDDESLRVMRNYLGEAPPPFLKKKKKRSDEENPEDDDEKDPDVADNEETPPEDGELKVDPAASLQPSGVPQFDTDNPNALPWVFLATTDEVNLQADGSVEEPAEEPEQPGITGFPAKGEVPPTAGGAGKGKPDGVVRPGEEEPPEGEEPEDGDEPGDEDPDAQVAPATNEPGDLPGQGKPPGAGVMPGDGEPPGPSPDDTGAPPDDAPDDEEPDDDDEEEPDDDDDDDDDEEDSDVVPSSGILLDSQVTILLGEPPCRQV